MTHHKDNRGLGMRDILAFNDAMLGKLSWRLIQNPNSLLARTLLGKYCWMNDFLSCECPTSASHGWRSILCGRDLIRKNIGWAIGNGKSVKLWGENWLSTSQPYSPHGPLLPEQETLRVSDLLDATSFEWSCEKISKHLPGLENEILAIKPSIFGGRDRRIWLKDKSGVYTTKSGYYAAKEDRLPPQLDSCLSWRSDVWRIQTAPKVKSFLWRAANGALPVGANLENRIQASAFPCSRVTLGFDPPPNLQFDSLWKACRLIKCPEAPCTPVGSLASWLCWYIWTARNKRVFTDRDFSVSEIITNALNASKEWTANQGSKPKAAESLVPHLPHDVTTEVICHSDAAWNASNNTAGLGWTIQAGNESPIQKFSATSQCVRSPLMAEGLAIRAALSHAAAEDIRSILVNSDSLSLIRALSSGSFISELHGILEDISLLSSGFENATFNFIPRLSNTVADSLAKSALYSVEPISI
ncbi:uncharacterized protein LOC112085418 [Eutrema salsugineum]|uniref:uncharacterized protein LOC112085418 n=1 Tax=Eutrema salsugineum TaxID=72664 RepID=UPI000CED4892|nr:uncharacterized protein LOC112085418 [Eutrema salsugineum]